MKKRKAKSGAYECPACGNETACGGFCGDACRDAKRYAEAHGGGKTADWQPMELVASRRMPVFAPYKNKPGQILWKDHGMFNIWIEPATYRRRVHKLVDS